MEIDTSYIIPKVPRGLIRAELKHKNFLRKTNCGNKEIYITTAHLSPNIMREIGRLRELSYVLDGGGTGKPCDIDEFDTMPEPNCFKQLFVWSPEDEEIVGGYRFIHGSNMLHLDHGPDFETCKSCIDGGFTSVMIDASSKPFAENIEITKKVVEYAHDHGVVVEAELGSLAGIEDDVKVSAADSSYTRPEEVEEFVTKTGCDSLAIAIGTSHGAYKFTPEQCTRNEKGILVPPPLRFDILQEVMKRLPGFPIVLHGSSSVPQNFVEMINAHGGKMPNAIGVPEEQLREAAKLAVCKINIDSDLRLAMTGTIRQFFEENPSKFDPREYLKPARANIKELVRHKLVNVLGCAGKA